MTDQNEKIQPESKTPGSGIGGIVVLGGLFIIILFVMMSRGPGTNPVGNPESSPQPSAATEASNAADPGLPKLLDLGSVDCVPCKMMEPILSELRTELDGKLIVEFIDVRVNRSAGMEHGVRAIPTQIFFDASGTELFRHIGFYSKEEILAKWGELGFDFSEIDE